MVFEDIDCLMEGILCCGCVSSLGPRWLHGRTPSCHILPALTPTVYRICCLGVMVHSGGYLANWSITSCVVLNRDIVIRYAALGHAPEASTKGIGRLSLGHLKAELPGIDPNWFSIFPTLSELTPFVPLLIIELEDIPSIIDCFGNYLELLKSWAGYMLVNYACCYPDFLGYI